MKRLLSVFAAIGCSLVAMPGQTVAQGTGGWTLFGGPERGYELDYYLTSGKADRYDRYELEIPGEKLNSSVTKVSIEYPDYYKGEFNTDKVEVVVGNEETTLQCKEMPDPDRDTGEVNLSTEERAETPCWVLWQPESQLIEIQFSEAVEARTNLELVFNRVENPVFGGMFNFNCRVSTVTGPRFPQYIGTWVVAID